MTIQETERAVELIQDTETLPEIAKKLEINYEKFEKKAIIVRLTVSTILSLEALLLFLKTSNKHRMNNQSFVIVTDQIAFDTLPDELVATPTLQEAYDIIDMELLMRDLEA